MNILESLKLLDRSLIISIALLLFSLNALAQEERDPIEGYYEKEVVVTQVSHIFGERTSTMTENRYISRMSDDDDFFTEFIDKQNGDYIDVYHYSKIRRMGVSNYYTMETPYTKVKFRLQDNATMFTFTYELDRKEINSIFSSIGSGVRVFKKVTFIKLRDF